MTPRRSGLRPGFLLTLLGLALAGTTLAEEPSPRTLYVRAKNTHLKDSIAPTASTRAILQPGEPVLYEGREGTTPWHRVSVEVKKEKLKGFIYQANLSSTPPSLEITSKQPGKKISPEAFASSGAAVKAVGPGVLAYGEKLPHPEGARQLDALEKLALRLEAKQVSDYARAGGLPTVVGSDKLVAANSSKPTSPPKSKKKETP
jgi:hypothetical protein